MRDTVLYEEFLKGIKGKGRSGAAEARYDPRIIALVRLLARRAAETDIAALLKKHKKSYDSKLLEDKNSE